MADQIILPNGRALLNGLMLTQERLWSGSKVAISVAIVRRLLSAAISTLPFDEEFYKTAYPDLAAAHQAGQIADLRMHFVDRGYFEGRFGVRPNVDEAFYRKMYPDVAAALDAGQLESAYDHYVKTGASEGRLANEENMKALQPWLDALNKK